MIMIEEITNCVCHTLGSLSEVWDKLGLTDQQRKDRCYKFQKHIEKLCKEIKTNEQSLLEQIVHEIEEGKEELSNLSQALKKPACKINEDLTLVNLNVFIKNEVAALSQELSQKLSRLDQLKEKDKVSTYEFPSNTVPSEDDFLKYEFHLKNLEDIKEERLQKFNELKTRCFSLLESLETTPEEYILADLLSSDKLFLHCDDLSRFTDVKQKLEEELKKNEKRSVTLRYEIKQLWNLLEIPTSDQNTFLATVPEHAPTCISRLENELCKLKLMRLKKADMFKQVYFDELTKLWEYSYVDEEYRVAFVTQNEMVGTELLEIYEKEINKWKEYMEIHQNSLQLFEQFLELFNEMKKLEEKEKDKDRLMKNRGGILLREEKERNRLKKHLPVLEEKLLEAVKEDDSNIGGFSVFGKSVPQYVTLLWNTFLEHREAVKNKRQYEKGAYESKPGSTGISRISKSYNINNNKSEKRKLNHSGSSLCNSKVMRKKETPLPAIYVCPADSFASSYSKFKDNLANSEAKCNSTTLSEGD